MIVPSITVLLSQHCRFRRLNGHDESVVLNFSLRQFSQTTEGSSPVPSTVTEERRSEQNLDAEDQVGPSESNQIKSFLLVYGAVKTTINDQGVVWVYGKGH